MVFSPFEPMCHLLSAAGVLSNLHSSCRVSQKDDNEVELGSEQGFDSFHLFRGKSFPCRECYSVISFPGDYVHVDMWDKLASGLSVVDGDM